MADREPRSWSYLLLVVGLAAASMVSRAYGQAEIRNFTDPILVPSSGGHTGEILALQFVPGSNQLLSGGLDKIVNVWDLDNAVSTPTRVIRPLHWRGLQGAIYAMAVSPEPNADGHRWLAVAGAGVQLGGGNILIYRYPGSAEKPTGDLVGILMGGDSAVENPAARSGHTQAVNALVFTPDGKRLISGSHDGTIRVWDLSNLQAPHVGVLVGHEGAVNALACVSTANGPRLASGGVDGVVRVWNLDTLQVVAERAAPEEDIRQDAEGVAINTSCLAMSRDGRWVVAGRENGRVERYSIDLRETHPIPTRGGPGGQGAAEALALSPDGKTLVTSILARRVSNSAEFPPLTCNIEIRNFPEGDIRGSIPDASNRVRVCAFSPDGRWLVAAGGDRQAIFVKDLTDAAAPVAELRGGGESIWDLGFDPAQRIVGWTRQQPDPAGGRRTYEGFDLVTRKFVDLPEAPPLRAIDAWDGWTVQRLDHRRLQVRPAAGSNFRTFTIELDSALSGRWWAHSFIPPTPRHPKPVIAVASEGGVSIYRLEDGQRTRVLSGHSGGVYCLAPSGDGVWLATGSSDQTLRLWLLDGCDQLPAIGAEFQGDPQGRGTVSSLVPRGFAKAAGLELGDVVERFRIRDGQPEKTLTLAEFQEKARDLHPADTTVFFDVVRGQTRRTFSSSLRDRPVLSLFPGVNHQWVLWMPEGFYDTSLTGDQHNLGWHVNPPWVGVPGAAGFVPTPQGTDYFAAGVHAARLHQTPILQTLIATADPVQAVQGRPEAPTTRPPDILIQEPLVGQGAVVVDTPEIAVRALATASPGRGVAALRYWCNSRRFPEQRFERPQNQVSGTARVELQPGTNLLGVEASDDQGVARTRLIAVNYRPKKPVPVSKLVIRTIGVGQFADDNFPEIPFAAEDVARVGEFLLKPGGKQRFADESIDHSSLCGPVTAQQIESVLDELETMVNNQTLGRGDTVILMIESHFLAFDGARSVLLASDAESGRPPTPSVSAERVSQLLGQISSYGCTVMLILDAIHESGPRGMDAESQVYNWVRELYLNQKVVVMVASKSGPSQRRLDDRLGLLAYAIVNSMTVRGQVLPRANPTGAMTLSEFKAIVEARVEELSSRGQFAECCVPNTIDEQIAIFEPR